MQAYHARDMSSEPALHRSLGLAGGGYEMIITLSAGNRNRLKLTRIPVLWSGHCPYAPGRVHGGRVPWGANHVLTGREVIASD
jgi:hypothetical protein